MLGVTKIVSIEDKSLLLKNLNETQAIFTFAGKFFIPRNPDLDCRIIGDVLYLHNSDFEKLKIQYESVSTEKEGWYTMAMLSKHLNVSTKRLKPVIDSLRLRFPKKFELQKKKKGSIAECFHFDIAKKAGKKLKLVDPRERKRKQKKDSSSELLKHITKPPLR